MNAFLSFITFKSWRDRREATKRRTNYDAIKAMIVQRHLDGFGGLVLDKAKYDAKDLLSFNPPMYQTARTAKMEPVIFWRKDLMAAEVEGKILPRQPKLMPRSVVSGQTEAVLHGFNYSGPDARGLAKLNAEIAAVSDAATEEGDKPSDS